MLVSIHCVFFLLFYFYSREKRHPNSQSREILHGSTCGEDVNVNKLRGKKKEGREGGNKNWERKISSFSHSCCILGKQVRLDVDNGEAILLPLSKASAES